MTDNGNGADVDGAPEKELGATLAELRKRNGLTGEALGARIGMSQSKVSKIESGRVRPAVGDVQRIAKALEVPDETLATLIDLAGRVHALPRRPAGSAAQDSEGRGAGQQEYLDRESKARHVRSFEVMLIPGLLQVSEYSRRIFNNFFRYTYGDAELLDTAKAVSLRTQRQEQLYDSDRKFDFVMLEAALTSPLLTPGYMLAQIDRLEFASLLPNVTVRIVRNGTTYTYPAGYGFVLLDEDAVLTEFGHTPVFLTDDENVNLHQRIFEEFWELADPELEPILTGYKTLYAEEARPKK